MSDPYLGEIRIFPFNFAPVGWSQCNGQVLQISQYTALFSLIGTYYGGDGVSTFALPDLRSRVPIHTGQGTNLSSYTIGETTGVETVALTASQMPVHSHAVQCNTGGGNQAGPSGNLPAVESTGTSLNYSNAGANATMNGAMNQNAGGGAAHTNIQPVLCLNFCIAMEGVFPSRD
jgi:microcystin-dependent protein